MIIFITCYVYLAAAQIFLFEYVVAHSTTARCCTQVVESAGKVYSSTEGQRSEVARSFAPIGNAFASFIKRQACSAISSHNCRKKESYP